MTLSGGLLRWAVELRPLNVAAGVSIALHALLLLGFIGPHLVSSVNVPAANRLHVRTVSVAKAVTNVVAAALTSSQPSHSIAVTPLSSTAVGEKPAAQEAEARTPEVAPASNMARQSTELSPAPDYLLAQGLDPPPQPLTPIDPLYPEAAGMQEGTVVLRLLIGSTGKVDDVTVVRSNPPGIFEESAVLAFAAAKFSPGYYLGIAVRSQLLVEVGFTPTNRGGAVSGNGRPLFVQDE